MLEHYKLDPLIIIHPGLSWEAMLKMTGIKLDLITDIDQYDFIEKGLCGGISYIANRYGQANNKYMKNYDNCKVSKSIMYLDANNLYGWAMSQYLPKDGFRWLTENELKKGKNLYDYENSKKGAILEVDLEYPKHLHDLHNDYPCGAEKIKVKNKMLSNYCEKKGNKYNISIGQVHKLIPTFSDKHKYVLHYRNLQLYTEFGLKIKKVHSVLEFNQSPWLKQYTDFNANE